MRRPLWIALVAGGMALLLALGVTSFVLMLQAKAAADPARIVTAYLGQVRAGHVEAAMRMEGRKTDPNEVLLTDAAYAKATERLSGFRVVRVRTNGDRAVVDVQTTAGGHTAHSSLSLKSGGWTPAALFGIVAWRLQPAELSMIDVHVGAPGSITATIAGAKVEAARHPALLAFPGRYAIEVPGGSPWFTVKGSSVAITGFQQREELTATAELTQKGADAAVAAANAWVQSCMQGGPKPSGCSFGLTDGATDGEVWTNQKWTLATAPKVTVSAWSDQCGLPGQRDGTGCWPVKTASAGAADFSADYSIPATGETGTITSTGSIEVDVEGGITGFQDAGAFFISVQWR
ncbi:hypothetical protein [Leifsonia sp. NPDC080035]|uniref:DUF4878 domain-containing protein n=1 Tax=Leifsonia sp. NPDC080035 TaxID=3143936 RepID=A0AAU7GHZ9_9MICO